MRSLSHSVPLLAIALMTGCDRPPTPVAQDGTIRDERFCSLDGLPAPLRQTTILIDARALTKSNNGLEFAERNAAIRDAVLSVADPVLTKTSGATAPRERIVLAVAPTDGTTAKTVFVGCVPGYSDQEAARLTAKTGWVTRFFGGDTLSKLDDRVSEFRQFLIGGMVNAAKAGEPAAKTPTGELAASSVLASVRASRGLLENEAVAQRIVLISDLSALGAPTPQGQSPRQAGIARGQATGGALSGAEINLLQPATARVTNRDWLEGFLLGQQAFLASASSGRFVAGSPAPTRRFRFVGRALYPSGPQALTIVLGEGVGGKLVSSFMILGSTPEYALQMSGTITCRQPEECEIADDRSGFAQAWKTRTGSQPQFDNEMPFAGMRHFKIRLTENKITGEVSDDSVIIEGSDRQSIPIEAAAK